MALIACLTTRCLVGKRRCPTRPLPRAHHTAHPPPTPPPFHQAALLVVNGLAVLNNDRCLEKWGLGHSLVGRGDGLTAGPGLLRRQVVEFLHAVTYLRGKKKEERDVCLLDGAMDAFLNNPFLFFPHQSHLCRSTPSSSSSSCSLVETAFQDREGMIVSCVKALFGLLVLKK